MSYYAPQSRLSSGSRPFRPRNFEGQPPQTYPRVPMRDQGQRFEAPHKQGYASKYDVPHHERSYSRPNPAASRFGFNNSSQDRPFRLPSYMTQREQRPPSLEDKFRVLNKTGSDMRHAPQSRRITFFQRPKALTETRRLDFDINKQVSGNVSNFKRTSIDFRNIEQRHTDAKPLESKRNEEFEESESEADYNSRSGRVSVRSMSVSDDQSPQFSRSASKYSRESRSSRESKRSSEDDKSSESGRVEIRRKTPAESESEQLNESFQSSEKLSLSISIKMDADSAESKVAEPEVDVPQMEEEEKTIEVADFAKAYDQDYETRKQSIDQITNTELKTLLRSMLATEKREFKCLQMCPQAEIENRMRDEMREEFEKMGGEDSPELKMVKRYTRSSADTELKISSKIRPPFVLRRTLDYLFRTVLPGKWKDYISLFHFIDDRLRSIRQDLNIIFTSNPLFKFSRDSVTCYEYMVRFYILSVNRLRTKEKPFDERDIVTALSETLKTLSSVYIERAKTVLKYKVSR